MSPQARPKKKKRSKTELAFIIGGVGVLLAVPCIGVVAAIAIPAYINYVKRSKTAEAEHNLRRLYDSAASRYETTRALPPDLPRTPAEPGCGAKLPWPNDADSGWRDLDFSPADPLYYAYEVQADPVGEVLTFRAVGDLDCDGNLSTFELTARVDETGELRRSPAMYRENELE